LCPPTIRAFIPSAIVLPSVSTVSAVEVILRIVLRRQPHVTPSSPPESLRSAYSAKSAKSAQLAGLVVSGSAASVRGSTYAGTSEFSIAYWILFTGNRGEPAVG
jgi:hypothetical protein